MAYTEFYTQNGGNNIHAGSTTSNSAFYSSVHGDWTNATGVFTVKDGTNASVAGVAVGMFASVYIDGATEAVWIARISTVQNATNGTITVNTVGSGAKPANQTATATIKVGGAWLGPNGASGFPFTLASFGATKDSTAHVVRVNMKNDQTTSLSAGITFATGNTGGYTIQGYTTSVEDGGRATWDGTTNTGALIVDTVSGLTFADIIFQTSISSGATDLVITGARAVGFYRCVFTGSRQKGLSITGAASVVECEAYGNNTSNTASTGAFHSTGSATFLRCIAHDNTTDTVNGFACILAANSGPFTMIGCISETNGTSNGTGIGLIGTSTASVGQVVISNCDLYNNAGSGIVLVSNNPSPVLIENCNFIKNAGGGITNASGASAINRGFVYNCGYGAGTQANGADTLGNLTQSGTVTYASGATPWADPANGDFRIVLAAARSAGRGAFTETATSYAGTIGYPDIGAGQALIIPELRIPSLASI